MKDCKCPWASFNKNHDEYDVRCHKYTWSKYSNNETMKCSGFDDCEFGTGFKGIDYDETFAFVGDKCFEHIEESEFDENDNTANSQVAGGNTPSHPGSTALLKQQIPTFL